MDIWQRAKELAVALHRLAEGLDTCRRWRHAEQLRAAALSVPSNSAEGSASPHPAEFRQFLNMARRSVFENGSILLVLEAAGYWQAGSIDSILADCDRLSRKITNYSRSLAGK